MRSIRVPIALRPSTTTIATIPSAAGSTPRRCNTGRLHVSSPIHQERVGCATPSAATPDAPLRLDPHGLAVLRQVVAARPDRRVRRCFGPVNDQTVRLRPKTLTVVLRQCLVGCSVVVGLDGKREGSRASAGRALAPDLLPERTGVWTGTKHWPSPIGSHSQTHARPTLNRIRLDHHLLHATIPDTI